MEPVNIKLMKRYLAIYKKDPKSRVFALLAGLYRKQGELDKALFLCTKGLKEHPYFAPGHIALALIFLDMNKLEMAAESLERATDYSPENIFAYKLLGQVWLKLKRPEKTLQAYKMLLLLDPGNKKAANIVKKLEPITAAQYDSTGFSFKSLEEVARHIYDSSYFKEEEPALHPIPKPLSQKEREQFETRCSMIEALIYRKELERAKQFLVEIKNMYSHYKKFGNHIEALEKKLFPVGEKQTGVMTEVRKVGMSSDKTKVHQVSIAKQRKKEKVQKLRQILARIEKFQSQQISY